MQTNFIKGLGVAAAVALLLSFGGHAPVYAQAKASACKGLDAGACKAKAAACTWVVPKKGKQKPYCRTKAAKKKK